MERRPLLFPGYVAAKLPIPLTLLSVLGCLIAFRPDRARRDKTAMAALLLLAAALLLILARSGAGYAGVRHALTVYFPLGILAGFAVEYLAKCPRRVVGWGTLALALLSCFLALGVVRPWEYHNILAGGTGGAYRTSATIQLTWANAIKKLQTIIIANSNLVEKRLISFTTSHDPILLVEL